MSYKINTLLILIFLFPALIFGMKNQKTHKENKITREHKVIKFKLRYKDRKHFLRLGAYKNTPDLKRSWSTENLPDSELQNEIK